MCCYSSVILTKSDPRGCVPFGAGTTLPPPELPARGDRQSRIPQAHDGLCPEGDSYPSIDDIFGAKKLLVTMRTHHPLVGFSLPLQAEFFSSNLIEISEENEARKCGSQTGTGFKFLTYDFVFLTENGWKVHMSNGRRLGDIELLFRVQSDSDL